MLDDAKEGKINLILVKDLSRFGRDYIQVGLYRDVLFPQSGVRFIAISDGYDSINNDKGANDFAPFKDIMNEWYAKDTSRKIKAVFNSKSRNGETLTFNIPYGYVKDPDNPKQWKIDEEAAEIVREIYQMIIQGYGTTKIAKLLTERGVLNPTAYKAIHQIVNRKYTEEGKTIRSFKTIDRIITNQAYAGDTVSNRMLRQFAQKRRTDAPQQRQTGNNRTGRVSYKVKKAVHYSEENWRVIPNTHEPIIERETWELVRKLFNGRRRRCTKHNYEAPLFTGHLFCADCGGKLYYVKPPEQAEYYCCCNYRKKLNGCTGHHIRADAVKELLIRKINSVIDFVSKCEDEFTRQVMERESADFQKETGVCSHKRSTAFCC